MSRHPARRQIAPPVPQRAVVAPHVPVIAWIDLANAASRHVAERIGLTCRGGGRAHPSACSNWRTRTESSARAFLVLPARSVRPAHPTSPSGPAIAGRR